MMKYWQPQAFPERQTIGKDARGNTRRFRSAIALEIANE
jgi:hypothetical protein